MADWQAMARPAEDAPVGEHPDWRSLAKPVEDVGVGAAVMHGINKGIVGMAKPFVNLATELPFRGADWLLDQAGAPGGRAIATRDKVLNHYTNPPEPTTTAGRYAGAAGEAVGSMVAPEAAIMSVASKAPMVARAAGGLAEHFIRPYVGTPGRAIAGDVTAAAVGGLGQEGAKEAGAGPGWQVAAGAAAPVLPIAGMAGVERIARVGADAISPTLARWQANGNAILKRVGISASADGGMPDSIGGRAASDQIIANQLRRAGVSVDVLERRLAGAAESRRFNSNSYAQDVTAPVDLDPSLQRLAGSVTRSSPEAANIGSDFMYGRQTGITPERGALPPSAGIPTRPMLSKPEAGAPPMGMFERVRDALKRAFLIRDEDFHGHAANANRTDQAIIKAAEDEAQSLYGKTYTSGRNADGSDVDLRPVVNPVIAQWKAAAAEEPGPVAAAINKGIKYFERAMSATSSTKSMIERVDKAKQFFDGEISKFFESAQGRNRYTGGVVNKFKNEVLAAIDGIETNELGKNYAAARDAFSSHMDAREALQMGRNAAKSDSDIGVDAFRSLSGSGRQKLFRLGLLGGYEKQAAGAKRTADITQMFETPRMQELLTEVIPRSKSGGDMFADRPERFGRYLGREKQTVQSKNEVFGNSKTAQRQADDEAFDTVSSVVEQFRKTPSILNVGIKVAESALNKVFGYRADTAAELARSLFTADPSTRAQMLARVRDRMGQERFAYFSTILHDQATSYSALGAAAVSPNAAGQIRAGQPGNPVPVSTPAEADKLPSGSHFTTPDGRTKVVP